MIRRVAEREGGGNGGIERKGDERKGVLEKKQVTLANLSHYLLSPL
jgi:hypothetical protein